MVRTVRVSWDIEMKITTCWDYSFGWIVMGGCCGTLVLCYQCGCAIRHGGTHQARCECNGYRILDMQWDEHALSGRYTSIMPHDIGLFQTWGAH